MILQIWSQKGKNPNPLESGFFEPSYYSAFLFDEVEISDESTNQRVVRDIYEVQSTDLVEFVEDVLNTKGRHRQIEADYLSSGVVWFGPFLMRYRSFPRDTMNKLEKMIKKHNEGLKVDQPSYA